MSAAFKENVFEVSNEGDSSSSPLNEVVNKGKVEGHANPTRIFNSFVFGTSDASKTFEGVEYYLDGEGDAKVSFGNNVCLTTGYYYLTGLGIGGAWGLAEGIKAPLLVQSHKFRWNAILNGITRRGPFVGNQLGVLAVYSVFIEYALTGTFSSYGLFKDNISAPTLSGVLSGALLRSPCKFSSLFIHILSHSPFLTHTSYIHSYIDGWRASCMAGALFGAFRFTTSSIREWNNRKHAAAYGFI